MSVTNTPSKNGRLLTPPDKHSWTRTPTTNTHASPSPAQSYGQLIGSLDNSTYAEFWHRLDTTRHSPNQSITAHAQTADESKPTTADEALHGASADQSSKSVPLPQRTISVPESASTNDSDVPRVPFTPDMPHAKKHTVDDASVNAIPHDSHPSKRLKQDAPYLVSSFAIFISRKYVGCRKYVLWHLSSITERPGRVALAKMSKLGMPTAQDYLRHAYSTLHRAQIVQPLPEDALHTILQRYAPDQERAHSEMLASVDASTSATEMTLEAVEANHWRRVAIIAGDCVSRPPAPDMFVSEADLQYTMAWWHIRIISLSKMLLLTLLRKELNALWTVLESLRIWDHEKQDIVPIVHSSIVPFSLHVLHAQQLFLGGFQREGAARLCQLIRTAELMSESVDEHIWHTRVIRLRMLLASILIEADQLPAAATVMSDLDSALQAKSTRDPLVHLMLTRLYLALGDIQHARSTLERAQIMCTEPTPPMAASIATHEALFHYTTRPHEPYDFPHGTDSFEASTSNQALTNTMALGALLRGDIVQSIQLLERMLQEHPAIVASSKALAHNLLTLHSLGKRE